MTALLEPPSRRGDARKAQSRRRSGLWVLPPLLLVVGFAVYRWRGAGGVHRHRHGRGWSTWTDVLGSSSFRNALWRTVQVAVTSTLGCLVLGTFLALVLAFVPFPGSKVVGRLIDTILSLPSFS